MPFARLTREILFFHENSASSWHSPAGGPGLPSLRKAVLSLIT